MQALAVCYLFSFVNPAHERRTREICREVAPELTVSLSSEVDPTFREYERLCVTAFDAYLGPVVKRYLAGLAEALRGLGIGAPPLIMRSRGGIVSAALAAEQPVTLFLSGPAGGVIGARWAAERSGVQDFVSLDMGGTSNDVAVVRAGQPFLAGEGSIGPYPVRSPMVDVNTIGAGGGSIAWIDAAGGLHVGPRSAGAEPGPACYGRGGDAATVTDASVVLGYLDPERFAGGGMRLDAGAARAAVGAVARQLGLDVVAAAGGIHRVINARMADQIRLVTIKRGYDPRQFALVVLGGAGPVHGVPLAAEMGMAEVIVPEAPGVLAAFGLLAAAIEHHHARTLPGPADGIDLGAVNRCLAELDAAGRARMAAEGVPAAEVRRRPRRGHALRGPGLRARGADRGAARPGRRARGGRGVPRRARARVRLRAPAAAGGVRELPRRPHLPAAPPGGAPSRPRGRLPRRRPDRRAPRVVRARGLRRHPDLRARAPGRRRLAVAGPAIVEQPDTTTVIPPGHAALVEDSGNLRIRRTA